MSDDTTPHDDVEQAGPRDDRHRRAAELTAEAEAIFRSGDLGAEEAEDDEKAEDEDIEPDDGGATGDEAGDIPVVAFVTDAAEEPDTPESAEQEPEANESDEAKEADADDTEEADTQAVEAQQPDDAEVQGETAGEQERTEQEDREEDVQSASAPAFPSFGVVFQAPDLSDIPRPRSRRATAGVTTPTESPGEDDEPGDAEDLSESHDEGVGEDQGQRHGRRRRRGGKGRRGRGSTTDQTDDGGEEPEDSTASSTDESETERQGGTTRGPSRRGRRPSGEQDAGEAQADSDENGGTDGEGEGEGGSSTRRRRRRRRSGESGSVERSAADQVTSVKGSTRLEAKRQRRREGREAGRRRTIITEAEFLARRESVERVMVVRGLEDRTQIAVLEDGVPVEHYVSRSAQSTMVGNVYLGRVQNVLPSMEAAFVDIGKGRNAVLYAGEVNWDAAGLSSGEPKRIENALKSGQSVLVQVTKDPLGHKGARLTSQVSLPGRYLVYVPGTSMTGISRKLPDTERTRLKKILKEVVPDDAGVIVRTAAEGASEAELRADVERLTAIWDRIQGRSKSAQAPALLHGEPDMTVRVIRDVFTEDFAKLVVSGEQAWGEVKRYIDDVAPDLADRVEKYTGSTDIFTTYRVHEAIAKAMDRKVWLPSGGSLVIDRTEAMTVVDVNTGKFTGSGGNLEETVTRNNIEAAEEIVRQLRLRDIGGIIVIDFIDMVLESNRDLVVRRLLECLGRDRTKHQVAEVTSLGLVQMTRKRVGSGLIEVFSEPCAHCNGRGILVQTEPTQRAGGGADESSSASSGGSRRGRGKARGGTGPQTSSGKDGKNVLPAPNPNGPTPAQIAAAAHAAALQAGASSDLQDAASRAAVTDVASGASKETVKETVTEAAAEVVKEAASPSDPAAVVAPEEPRQDDIVGAEPADTSAATTPTSEATTPTSEATAPATKRRRRGRVVAPAGPPTGASGDDTPDPA